MSKEPTLIIAAIMAVLSAIVGFGLNVSTDQLAGINAALIAIGAVLTRSQVSPKA